MSEKPLKYPRIKELREDRDLTQIDMAKLLNCSQSGYHLYEVGRRNIPNEVLIKLALFYKCSTDYLLGLTDEYKPYRKADQSRQKK